MIDELAARRLDVDLLARELGNWRTSSASGPAYLGLADGSAHADRRRPAARRRPVAQRAGARRRAAGVAHHRHRRVHADARRRLPQRPPGRAQHHGAAAATARPRPTAENRPSVNLAAATLAAPAAAVSQAFAEAAQEVTPYLHDIGIELTGVPPLRDGHRRKILRARTSHRSRRDHGDHRRAARDRADPGHLHPAR